LNVLFASKQNIVTQGGGIKNMEKVNIKLKNCYGIRKFEKEFDFRNKSAFIIYASNGSMKTSFTKTLKNISNGETPKEEVFGRESTYTIENEKNESIKPEEIFVIESYNANFYSKRISNLLMNKSLQDKYNLVTQDILDRKNEFLTSIKSIVGNKVALEEECLQAFKSSSFLETLAILIEGNLSTMEDSGLDFSKIDYLSLFDPKIEAFIKDDKNYRLLSEYGNQYDALVENSTFLKKGMFSQYNATTVNSTLNDNGFFRAGHKVLLQDGVHIKSSDDFEKMLKDEKQKILSDPKLLKQFDQIDKKLSANASLRNFRIIIETYPELIAQLVSYESFKRKSWIGIFKNQVSEVSTLVELFKKAKEDIKKIQEEAQKESERWRQVVDIFSNRFFVPFDVEISNQEDVVLKNSVPTLSFRYKERDEEKEIEHTKLNTILSGGERRALYLLNIIFELEALKQDSKKMLIVADDIAESFDYKNKYAIIEYLMEHYSCGLFNLIILTHNFDFYRTVGSRMLNSHRKHCVMAIKNEEEILVKDGQYLKNVFASWKEQFEKNDTILIASIPFIRNIVEYIDSEESSNYILLTKLLHMINYSDDKTTKEISLEDLEKVINDVWKTNKNVSTGRADKTVYDLIIEVADKIIANPNIDEITLENKIALSMAIRLIAEEFMIQQIIDDCGTDDEIKKIASSQTGKLLSLYKRCPGTNKEMLPILEEVSLMTAENIHLNSFMYEPLIDISILQLKKLYSILLSLSMVTEMSDIIV
jgi:ABC-type lipoprotein export system ATPase subunit